MLKALIKKQLLEFAVAVNIDKKTGKKRTKVKRILYILLFSFVYISLAFSFFAMAISYAGSLINTKLEWVYFALEIMTAISLAIFSSMFYTSSAIYKAKDNDLLLSMPISQKDILISRMFSIFLLVMIFTSIVLLPGYVCYWITKENLSTISVVFELIFILISAIFTTSLSCLFGYVVSLISLKLKNRKIGTVIISLVLFGLYYYVCFNLEDLVAQIVSNALMYGTIVKNYAYPIYMMAQICMGNTMSLIIMAIAVILIFVLIFAILSKSFYKLTLVKDSVVKKEYKNKDIKASNVDVALLKKEFKHYFNSATYMLNCSLGVFMMIVVGVIALIYKEQYAPAVMLLVDTFELDPSIVAIGVLAIVCMFTSMVYLTAPSISLEGKNIWILQSMPIDVNKIFNAKKNLHYILAIPSALILAVCLLFAFEVDFSLSILVITTVILFVMFFASLGLMLNVLRPNLTWTSEVVPIKQDLTIMICLFGGWIISALIAVGGYFALKYIQGNMFIVCILVLFSLLTRLINSWLATKGATIFSEL